MNIGLTAILGCGMTGMAAAAEFYVSTAGLDTNPGSQALPWKTLQKAADTLTAGDTVFVRGGSYARAKINVSGTDATHRITFANFPGETPVIDATGLTPPSGDTALLLIDGRKHLVIRGFEIRNYQTANPALIPAGILLTGACEDVQIQQCNVHDIWNTGGTVNNPGNAFGIAVYGNQTAPATGIIIDGNEVHHLKTGASESLVINGNVTNFQVSNNRVHDNNNIGIDFIGFEGTAPTTALDQARDGVCRGNLVWNITSEGNQAYTAGDYSADGIYCDGATRVIIEGNTVHHSDIGVELAAEHASRLTSAITLRNNVIYSNRQTGLFLGGYQNSQTGGSDACLVTGNTFYNNDTLQAGNGEIQMRYRTSNCVFRGNILSAGSSGWLVSVPVSAANNVNNKFDYNLYHAAAPKWSWNNSGKTTFATWKTAGSQDAQSIFTDPKFVTASAAAPDLHLRLDSPAVDAGDPAYAAAAGEQEIDSRARISGPRIDLGADELRPMDAWRRQNFGSNAMDPAIAAATANPAGDGIINLLKYALGLDPLKNTTSGLPARREETVGGQSYLALGFSHAIAATDISWAVQVSTDLSTWSTATTEVSRSQSGAIETLVVRDNVAAGSAKSRFIRLLVTQP